jgi:hypothetical protein
MVTDRELGLTPGVTKTRELRFNAVSRARCTVRRKATLAGGTSDRTFVEVPAGLVGSAPSFGVAVAQHDSGAANARAA